MNELELRFAHLSWWFDVGGAREFAHYWCNECDMLWRWCPCRDELNLIDQRRVREDDVQRWLIERLGG